MAHPAPRLPTLEVAMVLISAPIQGPRARLKQFLAWPLVVLAPVLVSIHLVACADPAAAATATVPAQWLDLLPGGARPAPARDMAFAYDPLNDRMILAAGGGTWALSIGGGQGWWSNLYVDSPNLESHAVYDPVGRRIVMITSAMSACTFSLTNPTVNRRVMVVPPGGR